MPRLWVVSNHPKARQALWDALIHQGFSLSIQPAPPGQPHSACAVLLDLHHSDELTAWLPAAKQLDGNWIAVSDAADSKLLLSLMSAGVGHHFCPAKAEALFERIVVNKRLSEQDAAPRVAVLPPLADSALLAALSTQVEFLPAHDLAHLPRLLKEQQPDALLIARSALPEPQDSSLRLLRQLLPHAGCLLAVLNDLDDALPTRVEANTDLCLADTHRAADVLLARLQRAQADVHAGRYRNSLLRNGRQWLTAREHALMAIADADSQVLFVSKPLCDLLGYTPAELKSGTYKERGSELEHPEQAPEMMAMLTSGRVWSGPFIGQHKDGSKRFFQTIIIPLRDDEGVLSHYMAIHTDTTQSRQLQARTEEQQRELSAILDSIPALVVQKDLHGHLLRVNRAATDYLGRGMENLAGRHVCEVFAPSQDYLDMDKAIVATGQPILGTLENVQFSDTENRWLRTDKTPIFDANGNVVSIVSCVLDVTEQQRIHDALRESEDRLRLSQRYAGLGMWDWDLASNTVQCSGEFSRLFGLPAEIERAPHALFFERIPPEDQALMSDEIRRCAASGAPYHLDHRVMLPDGRIQWLHQRGDLLRDGNGKVLRAIGISQDVTRRKQAELAGQRQQHLLDVLHTAASRYVESLQVDEASSFLINALLELTSSEMGLIGEVLHDDQGATYLRVIAAGELPGGSKLSAWAGDQPIVGLEFHSHRTLIGAVLESKTPVVSNQLMSDARSGGLPPGHPQIDNFLGIPIFHRQEMIGMLGIANRPGGYDQALIDFLAPLNATCGVLIHAMRMEQTRNAERAALRQAKEDAEQANQAKSAFLSSMSHELRTPLNAILGFAQLLETQADQDARQYVQHIESAGWHLLELINEVLDLARIESGNINFSREKIGLRSLVDECLALVASQATRLDISLSRAPIPDDAALQADSTRLRQVLLNFLSNAIKYNRHGGSVHVALGRGEALPNSWRITVSDSGKGLSPEQQEQLFQPFNRLGAEHSGIEGTGIGLAISKRLIELMGGQVGVASQPGSGSTFWLELPQASALHSHADRQVAPATLQPVELQHSVLCVEDNPTNLFLVSQVLKKIPGLTLMTASTGTEGMEIAKRSQPDLMILDINLPDMTGYQLLKTLRNLPETRHIPAIALSANAMPSDIERGMKAGFAEYLPKPIRVREFLNTISGQLRQSHSTQP